MEMTNTNSPYPLSAYRVEGNSNVKEVLTAERKPEIPKNKY